MTETPGKPGSAWIEFCNDAVESLEAVRAMVIEAPCCAA
jgi:hypothetical protein